MRWNVTARNCCLTSGCRSREELLSALHQLSSERDFHHYCNPLSAGSGRTGRHRSPRRDSPRQCDLNYWHLVRRWKSRWEISGDFFVYFSNFVLLGYCLMRYNHHYENDFSSQKSVAASSFNCQSSPDCWFIIGGSTRPPLLQTVIESLVAAAVTDLIFVLNPNSDQLRNNTNSAAGDQLSS